MKRRYFTSPAGAKLELLDRQEIGRRAGIYVRVISAPASSRFFAGEVEKLYLPASALSSPTVEG